MLLRKTTADGLSEMACSTVHIESHDSCKCGCDVEAAQCSDLQASRNCTLLTRNLFLISKILFSALRPSLLQVPVQRV